MPGVLGLVAGFLGIAEAAQEHIVASLQGKRKGPGGRLVIERGAIQHQAAENAIDLAASRAMVERTADIMDAIFARYPFGTTPLEVFHPAHADLQATKLFVNQAAIRVVDRALTMSGGSGYLSRSPLSRMYRDVRAGPFMQPLSPNEGYEYIGKLALGLPPDIFE
jgi:alkylation response protein AidB-like acyl-CoA dehydrogenase